MKSAIDLMRPPTRRSTLERSRFLAPARGDRPGMRWWWQSPVAPSELVRELRAIAAAGFGEVEIAFSPGFWADDAQRRALGVVLDEARHLGVGVASTLGAAWPLQTPNTSKGTPNASKELQYGVTYLDGAARTLNAPEPFDDPGLSRGGSIIALTLARVVRRGKAAMAVTKSDPWRGEVQEIVGPETSTILAAKSLSDVTGELRDGAFAWDGRSGEWALFAFWMRDSEQGVTSFLDRDAAVAATEYIDRHQIGEENIGKLSESGTDLFEDSLELNADSLFWSPDLIARFRSRHGYDVTPYLPVLFAHGMCRYWVPNDEPIPDFELDTGVGRRLRHDYNELLTDLYVNDHLLVLQEWAASYGLRHKAQVAYGQNLEPVRSNREFVRHGGRAEGESLNSGDRAPVSRDHPTWRFALDWQRVVVGGAHQGGGVRVSTELGAQFGAAYSLALGDLKQMLDKEWAAGITKPFVHGYASQEPGAAWPTQPRFYDYVADSWNDLHFPEWTNWRPLTDYWARGTVVLETGIPRTDVAIYRDGFLTTAARGSEDEDRTAPHRLVDAKPLEDVGFTIQFIDPVGLAEAGAQTRDGHLFPEGPAYRAVILDERAISADAAEALDAAAQRGLAVLIVGEAPTHTTGFADPSGDARVLTAVEALLGRPTVRRISAYGEAPATLRQLGIYPRARIDGESLLTQWRDSADAKYVLIYNTERAPVQTSIALEGEGELQELDLWSGDSHLLESVRVDGCTATALTIEPLGLRVFELVLNHEAGHLSKAVASSKHPEHEELAVGMWSLDVTTEEEGGPRRIRLEGQGACDWRSIPELAHVSGTGTYSVTVGAQDDPVEVQLGELGGSAVVRVNGRAVGAAYTSDATIRLDDALRAGGLLEIEVRTPLLNAVVAVGSRPGVGMATRPQGLVGPVRLRRRPRDPSTP